MKNPEASSSTRPWPSTIVTVIGAPGALADVQRLTYTVWPAANCVALLPAAQELSRNVASVTELNAAAGCWSRCFCASALGVAVGAAVVAVGATVGALVAVGAAVAGAVAW